MAILLELSTGKKLELTTEEARELHIQLKEVFKVTTQPVRFHAPCLPYWHPDNPYRATS